MGKNKSRADRMEQGTPYKTSLCLYSQDNGGRGLFLQGACVCRLAVSRFLDEKLESYLYDIPDRTSLYAFTFIVPSLLNVGVGREEIDKIMRVNSRKM